MEDIACTKPNGQIYITFKWFVHWIGNLGLRAERSIKRKYHKSYIILDFITLISHALKRHGQL